MAPKRFMDSLVKGIIDNLSINKNDAYRRRSHVNHTREHSVFESDSSLGELLSQFKAPKPTISYLDPIDMPAGKTTIVIDLPQKRQLLTLKNHIHSKKQSSIAQYEENFETLSHTVESLLINDYYTSSDDVSPTHEYIPLDKVSSINDSLSSDNILSDDTQTFLDEASSAEDSLAADDFVSEPVNTPVDEVSVNNNDISTYNFMSDSEYTLSNEASSENNDISSYDFMFHSVNTPYDEDSADNNDSPSYDFISELVDSALDKDFTENNDSSSYDFISEPVDSALDENSAENNDSSLYDYMSDSVHTSPDKTFSPENAPVSDDFVPHDAVYVPLDDDSAIDENPSSYNDISNLANDEVSSVDDDVSSYSFLSDYTYEPSHHISTASNDFLTETESPQNDEDFADKVSGSSELNNLNLDPSIALAAYDISLLEGFAHLEHLSKITNTPVSTVHTTGYTDVMEAYDDDQSYSIFDDIDLSYIMTDDTDSTDNSETLNAQEKMSEHVQTEQEIALTSESEAISFSKENADDADEIETDAPMPGFSRHLKQSMLFHQQEQKSILYESKGCPDPDKSTAPVPKDLDSELGEQHQFSANKIILQGTPVTSLRSDKPEPQEEPPSLRATFLEYLRTQKTPDTHSSTPSLPRRASHVQSDILNKLLSANQEE